MTNVKIKLFTKNILNASNIMMYNIIKSRSNNIYKSTK